MRTTLKRGIGRSNGLNGNGSKAILPPEIVPPVTRYRQPPPRRRGRLRLLFAVLGWLVALALITAGGVAGGLYLYFEEELVQELRADSPDVQLAQKELDIALPGEPTVALLVGYDKRQGPESELTSNSDTLMLVRADPDANTISMLSLPRDLRVEIRCPHTRFFAKINRAYSECGSRGSLETVRALTGLPIHYLVTVDFRGFKQLVAGMGGVWLDVDRRYFNDNSLGGATYAPIDLQPGYQKVNGTDALSFVRYRHFDSDLFRLARQQLFLKAFKQRARDFSVLDLRKIVGVIKKHVEIGQPEGGTLGARDVLSWALFGYQLPSGHFFQVKLDNLVDNPVTYDISVAPEEFSAKLYEFTHPDVAAAENATAAATGRKPKSAGPVAPAPKDTSVVAVNGNGVQGSAANAGSELERLGYHRVYPPNGLDPNAPTFDYDQTQVYFDSSQKGAEPAARKVAQLFGEAAVGPVPAAIEPLRNGAMLVVVVGKSFTGALRSQPPIDRTPARKPPAVRKDPGLTTELLRGAVAKARFPLLVPTVVEHTSVLERLAPVRSYQLGDGRAVRLTFATGASEYWGVQQTNWTEAPILSEPNVKQTIAGRKYELHYNGAKLHMVVLRVNGATYWVVNTLLDTLSNETMLAIAKGLKPLTPRT
jgi:LCP family protein required for cell wall assembly